MKGLMVSVMANVTNNMAASANVVAVNADNRSSQNNHN